MRTCLFLCFFTGVSMVFGQDNVGRISEARKAINHIENEQRVYDSLRGQYSRRWTLGFRYGQRFISNRNRTEYPDNITFTDFTKRRSFYGLSFGYFVTNSIKLGLNGDFLILPQEKEISSIRFGPSGVIAEGRGNGGVLVGTSIECQYYFESESFFRPYASVKLGAINMVAKGFSGSIDVFSDTGDSFGEQSARFTNIDVLLGGSYRSTPVLLLDFNIGYSFSNGGDPIGGVKSPGGITTSLSLQFILNPNKK